MHYLLKTLRDEGFDITPGHRILDFGCGNGDLTQRLRQDGYDVHGCDLQFKDGAHAQTLQSQNLIHKISLAPYRLPFEDNSFDYILSETVFEHVQNTDETIAELARVLKPGGATLHYFPAKYCPVENHLFIPFASFFRPYPYIWLCTALGLSKKKPRQMSLTAFAHQCRNYLLTGTKYLSTPQIRSAFGRHFPHIRFVEKTAIRHSPSRLTVTLGEKLGFLPFLPWIFRNFKAVVILTSK
jgi:ubiquinone/menaquinone biosynthesis C-methylase UbiE